MMSLLKLLIAEWFGSKSAKLDGSNLFVGDYSTANQYTSIVKLFGKDGNAVVRIPVQSNTIQQFLQASRLAHSNGIKVVALLDAYESDNLMMGRLSIIKSQASYVKYFELLNELPHMNNLYTGEKITSMKQLLDLTNKYSDWVHQNISGGKVITMAPYNVMDERNEGWDVTNTDILKQLILYTVADISAVHLYGDSLGKKLQLAKLSDNITAWNKEAKYKKSIWVTECGIGSWKNQVNYYDKMVKLMKNLIDIEKIIWYRQAIKSKNLQDAGFALEIIENLETSPLYNKLMG